MAQIPNPPGQTISSDQPTTNIESGPDGPGREKSDDDKEESTDSEGDQTEKEEGVDPDILAELSDVSEDSDLEEVVTETGGSGPKGKRKRRLRVSDTLVSVILGLWTIRVPVMGVDIES